MRHKEFKGNLLGITNIRLANTRGKSEDPVVMVGTQFRYIYEFDLKGKLIGGKNGGPGFKVVDVITSNNPKQPAMVLLGSKQSEVRLIRFINKIQELWIKNVGGEVNDIRHGDYNGDGNNEILVGTESFQFYVLRLSGKVVFRKTLDDRVLNSKSNYLAVTAGGRLSAISEEGNILETFHFPSAISNILERENGFSPVIVLESGDLYKKTRN